MNLHFKVATGCVTIATTAEIARAILIRAVEIEKLPRSQRDIWERYNSTLPSAIPFIFVLMVIFLIERKNYFITSSFSGDLKQKIFTRKKDRYAVLFVI